MTDIHSHIIFDVDDGSRSLKESIEILRKMKKCGFDNAIITPHFIEDTEYSSENKEKEEKLEQIKQKLKEEKIDINVFIGNEVYINTNIKELIKSKKIETLNNSQYILIEFPFHNRINSLYDILYELKHVGLIPIIAHPERYSYFQDNYSLVDELKDEEVLFQCNYASILGHYGKDAEKLMKYMLKKQYVDFLGTDLHREDRTFVLDKFKKIEKEISKVTGKDYYKEIKNNSDLIVG